MQVSVLVTNGGPHSAAKWAAVTAAQIISIAADSASVQAIEGRKLELQIIGILEGHHGEVQAHERGEIERHGHRRLVHMLDAEAHALDDKVNQISQAAAGTIFEAHFGSAGIRAHIRAVLKSHFETSMDIERSWHADRHAHTIEARAYRAAKGA